MSVTITSTLFFIACHGGPADHFATYAKSLTKHGYEVQIHATGAALKKFQEHQVEVKFPFSLDHLTQEEEDLLAQTIAKTCSAASVIITDLGHLFDIKIQQALKVFAKDAARFTYYDNPEPFVPGGYSTTAAAVINLATGVLFANANLVNAKIYRAFGQEIDFGGKERKGIGYYPVSQADKISEIRKSTHETARVNFLSNHSINDTGQKILVYFGGNNEEYFSKAFPAFLYFVAKASEQIDLRNTIILLQQHPGAVEKNQDGQLIESWLKEGDDQSKLPKVILSDFYSDTAQILADAAFYYQTSMGPQFVLEEIPTVQIGHETFNDILVRNGLAPTVTSVEGFVKVLGSLEKMVKMSREDLLKSLGIKKDWQIILENVIMQSISSKPAN